MIRIGYSDNEKLGVIDNYRARHPEVQTIIVFSPKRFWLPCEYEQYEWADIIMYKVFYPLLERIDGTYLIVVNECLRTQNRNDLTYNCLHHYLNQTPHRMVFEYLPFIEDKADFMILADKMFPGRYKGRGYDKTMLKDLDLSVRPVHIKAVEQIVVPPDGAAEKYASRKQALFDSLGNGDPDTIPRQLHVWCGQYKRPMLADDIKYVARNARYGKNNVFTYKDAAGLGWYTVLDFPHRRIDFNDFLKTTRMTTIQFLSTKLPVDDYYFNSFTDWMKRLEDFYAEASLHQSERR